MQISNSHTLWFARDVNHWRNRISEDAAFRVLSDLVSIPSTNPGSNDVRLDSGEAAIADYVADYFSPYGVDIDKREIMPNRWNVLVQWRVGGADHEILWEAHLDTVPAGGMADPFVPRVESGRLYGRGACDDKGSLAAMMLALRALLEADVALHVSLSLLGTADEEYKARGIQHYVASCPRPTLAVFGEPTELRIVTAQRGAMIFHITTYGQAAHASQPSAGVNAIYLMAEAIHRIRDLAERHYPSRVHPLCGRPTVNVGRIEGGTEAWIVPDRCTIAVDRRWIPGEDWETAWEEIRDAVMCGGEPVEVERPTWMTAEMDMPQDEMVVGCLYRAAEKILGRAEIGGAPFTSEAPYLVKTGVPAVIFGPGSNLQAHSNEEFVKLAEVVQAAKVLAQFAVECDAALCSDRSLA